MRRKAKTETIFARLAPFAGTGDTRPNLQQIVVETDRAWAADGHRLQIVRGVPLPEPGIYTRDGVLIDEPRPMPLIDQVVPAQTAARVELDAPTVEKLFDLDRCLTSKTDASFVCGPDDIRVTFGGGKRPQRSRRFAVVIDTRAAQPLIQINLAYLLAALHDLNPPASVGLQFVNMLAPVRIDTPRGTAIIMPERA